MSTNPICIDSPFFRVPPPFHSLKPEQDPLPENKEAYVFPFGATSPEILPPVFQPSSSAPMTPWSALLNSQLRQKPAELTLPCLFGGDQGEGIEQRITFSEGEEECCLLTPVKQHHGDMEQELSSLQLLTTSRRPSFEPLQMSKGCRGLKMGLKKLTQQAYHIVSTLRDATYKEVADRLVRAVQFEEEGFDQSECQEQNIKRRVYDALNVMIAVGLLKKDGRKVTTGRLKAKRINVKQENEEAARLAQQVKKQEDKLKEKGRRLQEAQKKMEAVRYLLAKNRNSLPNQQEKVYFPFIGVSSCSQLHITHHSPEQLVIITTLNQQLHPFGDIDSLQWLKGTSPTWQLPFP